MMKRNATQAGFSLLELLLATVVFFAVLLSIFQVMQDYAEREAGRTAGKYMTTIADAMDQVLSKVENFQILYNAAVANGGGLQLIADANEPAAFNIAKDFQIGGRWIQRSRLLNANFRYESPLRSQVRILLRVADNIVPGDAPAFDIFIVTATPRPDGIVRRAALESGAAGGVIRSYGAKGVATATSIYDSWRIRMSAGLTSTNWYQNELRNSLDTTTDGSYFVYYRYSNVASIAGDYLFRVADPDGTGERNRMHAVLNAGGNDIIGADDVNIGTGNAAAGRYTNADATSGEVNPSCVDSTLCVNGTAALKGAGIIAGNMTTTGSALIADSLRSATMNVDNKLGASERSTYGAEGQFVVDGNGNDGGGVTDRVILDTGLTRAGATVQNGTLNNTEATTLTMPGGGILTTNNILNTRRVSSAAVDVSTLTVTDDLRAGAVTAGEVVNGARTGVIDIYDTKNMIYGSDSRQRTLNVPRLTISEGSGSVGTTATGMRLQEFGNCNIGCGDD